MAVITEIKETKQRRDMAAGFTMALYTMKDFFTKHGYGIKVCKLNSYEGLIAILEELMNYKEQFFIKGTDINCIDFVLVKQRLNEKQERIKTRRRK